MKRASFFLDLPEPRWIECEDCHEKTAEGYPCARCERERVELRTRVVRDRARGFPARFDWVAPRDRLLGAPELRVLRPIGRPDMRAIVKALHDDGRPVVTLVGPAGSGKTTLAVAAARLAPLALYVSAVDLERAMGAAIGAKEGEPDLVRHARECRVLIVDDMGKEPGTRINPIPAIVQARHDAVRKTYITTGLEANEVGARYDDGIRRRLFEAPSAMVVRWT